MGVDPARGVEQGGFRLHADRAQLAHVGVSRAGRREAGEVGRQKEGAAPQQSGIHVAMAAVIDVADEAGLGVSVELVLERLAGQVGEAMAGLPGEVGRLAAGRCGRWAIFWSFSDHDCMFTWVMLRQTCRIVDLYLHCLPS